MLSCHPVPTAAVTLYAVLLGAVAGVGAGRLALLAAAVLLGQLSIGWSNDALDAGRDAEVGRRDKPLAASPAAARTVQAAAGLALAGTVAASLGLGWRAGVCQLVLVVSGWAYNVGLKATVLSWLPYATGFGALPAAAVFAAGATPAAWAVAAGALLGVAAHLANVLPDLEQDAATGVRGLPHRLGARGSVLALAALLAAAVAVAAFGPAGSPSAAQWTCVGIGAALLAGSLPVVLRRPSSRAAFYGVLALAALVIVLLAVSGTRLT